MDWQSIISIVPLPVMLGMVLYVNHKLENHESGCSVREIVIHIKEKQADIDTKINIILERLMQ